MALGKLKDTWFIWVLVIVAIVFAVLAFSKDKSQPQASADTKAVLADQGVASTPDQASQPTIKADHSSNDMGLIAANKQVSAVVAPLKNVTPKDSFAIQVYSFKEKPRAEASLRALKDKNFPAYIMVSDLGPRGIWYRVRVGAFNTELEALDALDKITKDFKSGIIVSE